jgi:hypothetical protein
MEFQLGATDEAHKREREIYMGVKIHTATVVFERRGRQIKEALAGLVHEAHGDGRTIG